MCNSLLIYHQTVKMEFGPVQKNSSALICSVISIIFWQICHRKLRIYFCSYRMRWNLIVWHPLMIIVSHMWCKECKKYRYLITNVIIYILVWIWCRNALWHTDWGPEIQEEQFCCDQFTKNMSTLSLNQSRCLWQNG